MKILSLIFSLAWAQATTPLPERPVVFDNYRHFGKYFRGEVFEKVLADMPAHSKKPDIDQVNQWIRYAHRKIKYRLPIRGKTPEERLLPGGPVVPRSPASVESSGEGDCKEKALWLFAKLQDRAAGLVFGRTKLGDKDGHAWVYYHVDGQWWILDPTNRDTALAMSAAGARYYPVYSLTADAAFKHCSEKAIKAWPGLDY